MYVFFCLKVLQRFFSGKLHKVPYPGFLLVDKHHPNFTSQVEFKSPVELFHHQQNLGTPLGNPVREFHKDYEINDLILVILIHFFQTF